MEKTLIIPRSIREIKKIEDQLKAQGQTLDQVLQFQGMDRTTLRDQIRLQKMVEKMVGEIQVTDEEVEAFISENEQLANQEDTTPEQLQQQARDQLRQQKTDMKIQELIQNLRKNANIQFYTVERAQQ